MKPTRRVAVMLGLWAKARVEELSFQWPIEPPNHELHWTKPAVSPLGRISVLKMLVVWRNVASAGFASEFEAVGRAEKTNGGFRGF